MVMAWTGHVLPLLLLLLLVMMLEITSLVTKSSVHQILTVNAHLA